MITERIGEIIDDPISVSDVEVEELKGLSDGHPWCGTFHLAYLLALKAQGGHLVTSELNRLAIRIHDRALLHTRFEEIEEVRKNPEPVVAAEQEEPAVETETLVEEVVAPSPVVEQPTVEEQEEPEIPEVEATQPEEEEIQVEEPAELVQEQTMETPVEPEVVIPEEVEPAEESEPVLEQEEILEVAEVESQPVVEEEAVEETEESEEEPEDEFSTQVLAEAHSFLDLERQFEQETIEEEVTEEDVPVAQEEVTVEPVDIAEPVMEEEPSPETEVVEEGVSFDFSAIRRMAEEPDEEEQEEILKASSDEVLSFADWLMGRGAMPSVAKVEEEVTKEPAPVENPSKEEDSQPKFEPKKPRSTDLIDRFIAEHGDGLQVRRKMFDPVENARRSLMDEAKQVSETLAKVYAAQGSYIKAIEAYESLKLRYPERSAYFAARISELEKNLEE